MSQQFWFANPTGHNDPLYCLLLGNSKWCMFAQLISAISPWTCWKCFILTIVQIHSGLFRASCPLGKRVLFSLSLVLWASWKELKEQVCYTACPEKDVEEFHLNIYFSKGQVNLNSHLSHRQKYLSRTNGHRVFRTLSFTNHSSDFPTWGQLNEETTSVVFYKYMSNIYMHTLQLIASNRIPL